MGIMEYEYSLAAKKCGIAMTDTKLFDNKYYGIKRFDREKKKKVHTISAAALFNVDFRIPSLDYTLLLRGTMVISKDITEVIRLFRLMVFNVLAKNRDDHAKKFTFIYKEDRWLLSPAYDLVYSSGFNGQHTTMVSGSGLPNKKEIMEVAKSAGINKKSAELVYEEVSEGVKGLKKFFK
jgi:serine/threonine-protein kinase HipA